MEKFCDFITDPAWCAVVLTAINTIAVVIIAWMQIRMQHQQTVLQKRQTEAQEYEIYKQLYKILKPIHGYADRLLFDIFCFINTNIYYSPNSKYWSNKALKLEELSNSLSDCEIDIELKFAQDSIDKEKYHRLISLMQTISYRFDKLLANNNVTISNTNRFTIQHPYTKAVNSIVECISEERRNEFRELLLAFLNTKEEACNPKILEQIKNRCNIFN